jgi:hypothetical protein
MVYPVLTNEKTTTESQRYNCFTRNGGKSIPKHAGPEAKCSNPTTGLTLLCPVTHSREILTTGKSHGKKQDRFSLNYDKHVLTSLLQDSGSVANVKEKKGRHVTQDLDVNRHRTDSLKTFRTGVY